MRSSHHSHPGEGAPLLRETPRQRVVVEFPALRQAGRQAGGKGSISSGEQHHISTARLSSVSQQINTFSTTHSAGWRLLETQDHVTLETCQKMEVTYIQLQRPPICGAPHASTWTASL